MDWSKIINEVTEHEGISKNKLAISIGCSRCYMGLIVNGKRKSPSYEIGIKIILRHPDWKQIIESSRNA